MGEWKVAGRPAGGLPAIITVAVAELCDRHTDSAAVRFNKPVISTGEIDGIRSRVKLWVATSGLTEVYAEKSFAAARKIAARVG